MAPNKTKKKSEQEVLKYDEIQDECFNAKTLFEDTAFPAAPITISMDLGEEIKWLRPSEVMRARMEGKTAPEFVVDGANRHDINQGRLGNYWLMEEIDALCENEKLFDKVVDPDQGFDEEKKYCGVFRFRFWRFGDWVEVCVDDRLPTINGNLVFLQNQGESKNEFWPALFEKAYAKIYGSYAGLKGEPIETLKGALEKGALVGAGINPISARSRLRSRSESPPIEAAPEAKEDESGDELDEKEKEGCTNDSKRVYEEAPATLMRIEPLDLEEDRPVYRLEEELEEDA